MGLCTPERLGRKRAQNGQKSPKAGPSSRRVLLSPLMDRIHLGNVWDAFLSCFDQFCLKIVSCLLGPTGARLGLDCVPRSETIKWPHLRLDRPNRDSKGTFPPCKATLLVVSTSQMGPNALLDAAFARQVLV